MSERKLVVHGSKTKGLTTLEPPQFAFMGKNGAQHGVAVYSYPLDRVELSIAYAGEDGSIYLSEVDTSEFIRVDEDQFLGWTLKEMLFDIVESTDDMAVKVRLATDLAGREERLFESEEQAEEFYERMMSEAENLKLPDRYHPEFEEDRSGYVVVSCFRDDLDDYDDIDANTSMIHRSLTAISSELATNVWSKLANGLIITDLSGGEFYASFSKMDVKQEFSASMGVSDLIQAIDKHDPVKNQILNYDLTSRNSILYIGQDGKLSIDMSDVYPVEGELYIESHRNTKIYFEHISGEHPVVPTVIAALYRSYPNWKEAEIRFDNNPKITLQEMHEKFNSLNSDDTNLKLYHGTTSEFLPSIATTGLQCRNTSGTKPHYFNGNTNESYPDRVYFASEFGLGAASAAARSAASTYGGFPVILEFDVTPDLRSKLAADEDSKKLYFDESLSAIGTCSFVGDIDPERLSVASDRINQHLDGIKMEYARLAFSESKLGAKKADLSVDYEKPANTKLKMKL